MAEGTAKVAAVRISPRKGAPMLTPDAAVCVRDWGLEGDVHAGKGSRQVSFLGLETATELEKLEKKGLCALRFAENITMAGIRLFDYPVGTVFSVGECEFEITEVGKSCFAECAVFRESGKCPLPREVVFARVRKGGKICPGDTITADQTSVPSSAGSAGFGNGKERDGIPV